VLLGGTLDVAGGHRCGVGELAVFAGDVGEVVDRVESSGVAVVRGSPRLLG